MRPIKLILAVAAMTAVMLVTMVAPAFAQTLVYYDADNMDGDFYGMGGDDYYWDDIPYYSSEDTWDTYVDYVEEVNDW